MNYVNIRNAKFYTNWRFFWFLSTVVGLLSTLAPQKANSWEIDFSRRLEFSKVEDHDNLKPQYSLKANPTPGYGIDKDLLQKSNENDQAEKSDFSTTDSLRAPASDQSEKSSTRNFKNTKSKAINSDDPKSNFSQGILQQVLQGTAAVQDIVIINTPEGFIPSLIQVRNNGSYRVVVVNVHPTEKNISFIMDAYSQHHGTLFGEPKSFVLNPKIEGIFSFQCPETGAQGKWIVLPDGRNRKLASEVGGSK